MRQLQLGDHLGDFGQQAAFFPDLQEFGAQADGFYRVPGLQQHKAGSQPTSSP